MHTTIRSKTGFLSYSKAIDVAEELQSSDPDWKYIVVDCNNGWGRIDIYDEDGELVESGFLPT